MNKQKIYKPINLKQRAQESNDHWTSRIESTAQIGTTTGRRGRRVKCKHAQLIREQTTDDWPAPARRRGERRGPSPPAPPTANSWSDVRRQRQTEKGNWVVSHRPDDNRPAEIEWTLFVICYVYNNDELLSSCLSVWRKLDSTNKLECKI